MKEDIVLALDQSTSTTGWALFIKGELKDHGAFTASGDREKRIEDMRQWLVEKIEELTLERQSPITLILEEIQHQRNVNTFRSLAHVQGVLINTGYQKELANEVIKTEVYFASEWKKTCGVTGRKSAEQKANAQKFIRATYNIEVPQDTCDAICLGYHHTQQKATELNFG